MWFIIFVVLVTSVGLAGVLMALTLAWREARTTPGWLGSRRGMGALCLLLAGAALVAVAQAKLVEYAVVLPRGFVFLHGRLALCVVAGLALLAVGAVQVGRERPKDASAGPLAWCIALALLLTLAGMNVFQFNRYLWDENFIHELPDRTLDVQAVKANTSYKNKYDFRPETEHYFARDIPFWEKALEPYKGKPDIHYLEVGLFEGRSAMWIMENILTDPSARLTGIDPFFDSYENYAGGKSYKEVFLGNLKASGGESKANIIQGFSQIELRKLPPNSFDIIYIDGSHERADVLEDAVLSWRLLKDGGTLIFDDYLLPGDERPKSAIDAFVSFYGKHFDVIHVDEQVMLRKKAARP
jgi:predicted O-methyltransferase YrrM